MVERRGVTIGQVSILKTSAIPEIQIVISNKNNWGHGYGSMVGTWLLKHAKREKITAAKMHVWANNHRSIALGKKFGFKPVCVTRRRVGNRYRQYLLMKVVLAG